MKAGIGWLMLFTCGAWGDIAPIPGTQPVGPVFRKADLVCACVVGAIKVMEGHRVGSAPKLALRQHVAASVVIADQFKPVVPLNPSITVEFDRETPTTKVSMPAIQKGERAIMFLRASGPSTYVFADPFLAAVPFNELPQQSGEQGLNKLESVLRAVLVTGRHEDQVHAMELLEGLEHVAPDTAEALVLMSRSPDPTISLPALAVLLKANLTPDITKRALEDLLNYLHFHDEESEPAVLLNVSSQLARLRGAEFLPALDLLSASKFLLIRRGAMQSLRAAKNPQAAWALVNRLEDTDGYVRYLAVISLAETFGKNGDYAPSMYLFDRNPDFYLGLWKSWWSAEGRAYWPASN